MMAWSHLIITLVLAASAFSPIANALSPVDVGGSRSAIIEDDELSFVERDGAFRIERLPGWDGPLPSEHRAGYVTVNETQGRRLYFYLAASESPDPSTADDQPLIVWLTGGPGCSSLDAFAYEHGPFNFRVRGDCNDGGGGGGCGRAAEASSADDVRLERNPFSWTKAAHVLYVDSPAGAGMSYARDPAGLETDDAQTVEDLLRLVLGVMDLVPDLRYKEVVIAGESYAGVYVPLLAERILRHNDVAAAGEGRNRGAEEVVGAGRPKRLRERGRRRRQLLAAAEEREADGKEQEAGEHRFMVNVVGYAIGNGVTDDEVDGNSQLPFAWGAGLIDDATHASVLKACGGGRLCWNATEGSACREALDAAEDAIGDINPYAVGSPCFFPRRRRSSRSHGGAWPFAARFERGQDVGNWWRAGLAAAAAGREWQQQQRDGGSSEEGLLGHTVACADRRAALAYFNDPRVRRAIHAAPRRVAGGWQPCSDALRYRRTAATTMVPVHGRLLRAGVRALVYSGVDDYVVPFTGTRQWTASLGLPVEAEWRAWKVSSSSRGGEQPGQVGGHSVRYRGAEQGPLTFATVLGAGHMVPQQRPEAALSLLKKWLEMEV